MHDPLVALADLWLAHPTYGLAARLAALPITGSSAPSAPLILTDRGNGALARGRLPAAVAADRLYITAGGFGESPDLEGEFQTRTQDGTALLLFTWERGSADTDAAVQAGRHVLRALRWTLMDFNSYRDEDSGVRDAMEWLAVTRFTELAVTDPNEDTRVVCTLRVTCQVRDYAADL